MGTPKGTDYIAGTAKPMRDGRTRDFELKHFLAHLHGGSVYCNPAFLEEMMGFPVGYTLEPFLKDDEDK